MRKSRLTTCILGIVALTLVLSIASAPPSNAWACDTAIFWANATGSGVSCPLAEDNCQNNAQNEADYACTAIYKPLCYLGTFEITQSCYLSNGAFHVSCRVEGACVAGPDGGGPDQ